MSGYDKLSIKELDLIFDNEDKRHGIDKMPSEEYEMYLDQIEEDQRETAQDFIEIIISDEAWEEFIDNKINKERAYESHKQGNDSERPNGRSLLQNV